MVVENNSSEYAEVQLGKLNKEGHSTGYLCIKPNQEWTVTSGSIFRRRTEKQVFDEVAWVSEWNTEAEWGVLNEDDKKRLQKNQFLLKGVIFNILWLNSAEAKDIFDEYFDSTEKSR